MSRKRITTENFYYIDPYRSILQLFVCFENTSEWQERGLTFEHLRLALLKNQDIEKLDGIFGKRLRRYAENGLITIGCIKTKNDLNNTYLKKLLELKIIKKDSRFTKPRYVLSDEFGREFHRILNKDCLDEYRSDQIMSFVKEGEPASFIIYGISRDMIEKEFTDEDNKKMGELLTEIENHIREIEAIKIQKLYQRLIKKGVKVTDEIPDYEPHPGISISRVISSFDAHNCYLDQYISLKNTSKFDSKRAISILKKYHIKSIKKSQS